MSFLKYTPSFNSFLIIEFFFISRHGHFHAWVFCFCSACGLASSCILLIFLCFISHLHDIFLRGHFFLMFYIEVFSFVGLVFVLWVSTCFFDFVAIVSIFLLLLPFPSAWPYSLDCCSQPLEQHFLLALILKYLFHVRLIQMAFGIQISWAWRCKLQSGSWEKKGHPNSIKAKKGWTSVLQVVCSCADQPCRAIPAPRAWQKCSAILLLLASFWLPLPVGTCGVRYHVASQWLAESIPLYARTCDALPWLFPCSWQIAASTSLRLILAVLCALCLLIQPLRDDALLCILLFIILNPFRKAQTALHPEGWFTICSKWKTSG